MMLWQRYVYQEMGWAHAYKAMSCDLTFFVESAFFILASYTSESTLSASNEQWIALENMVSWCQWFMNRTLRSLVC